REAPAVPRRAARAAEQPRLLREAGAGHSAHARRPGAARPVPAARQGQGRYLQGTAEGRMTSATIPRPGPSEYVPYYETYISKVPKGDLLTVLEDQRRETQQLLAGLSDTKALHRYPAAKRSIKAALGHMMEPEGVFLHRALTFLRAAA